MSLQEEIRLRNKIEMKEPAKYKVIMHNDDFTTMDFVVEILIDIFHKQMAEAETLMLKVHQTGSACVGIYPYDIAKTKVVSATKRARANGFPFRMSVEKE